jgi:hypothetical protein
MYLGHMVGAFALPMTFSRNREKNTVCHLIPTVCYLWLVINGHDKLPGITKIIMNKPLALKTHIQMLNK